MHRIIDELTKKNVRLAKRLRENGLEDLMDPTRNGDDFRSLIRRPKSTKGLPFHFTFRSRIFRSFSVLFLCRRA